MTPEPEKSQARNKLGRASLVPRGLSRAEAAAYVGISASLFDELVIDGRMPRPKLINTRNVWDRYEIDAAFDELPVKGTENPWDDMFR